MAKIQITLVTGNRHKLIEWQRLVPTDFDLRAEALDLDEIQSLDMETIVIDKVKRAYTALQRPVIVEDVSAGLDKLGELPGPFIKFFEMKLGTDALFQLAEQAGDPVTVRCAVAYYDGENLLYITAVQTGSVVTSRGSQGFGFDCCFVPNGQTKTYAEMSSTEKDRISHRSKAVRQLLERLKELH